MASPWLATGAGAAAGLEDLLTRQRIEQQQKVANDARSLQLQETQRSNMADEGYRDRALGENIELRKLQQQGVADQRDMVNQDRDAQRTLTTIALRPMGSAVGFDEYSRERQAGAPEGLYGKAFGAPLSGDQGEQGPALPTINFQGTQSQQQAATNASNQDEQRRAAQAATDAQNVERNRQFDEREQRMSGEFDRRMTEMEGRVRSNGQTRTVKGLDKDGVPVERLIDGQGNILYEAPSQPTGAQREKNATDSTDLEMLNDIEKLGNQTQWGGTGMVAAPVGGFIKRATGYGDDQKDMLRTMLSTIQTSIAHEKFGSAFTANERQMLATFAPGPNMDGSTIKNRIAVLKHTIQTRLNQRQSGQQVTPVADLLSNRQSNGQSTNTPAPASSGPKKIGRFTVVEEP